MRPRLTVVALLALAVAMTATGTVVAGSEYGTDASTAQYGSPNVPSRPGEQPEKHLLPSASLQQAQEVEQVEAGANTLADTGLAVVPVLLLGVALVGTGLALRRRDQRGD